MSEIIGKSPGIKKIHSFIAKVAPTDGTVLILGETGVGKELIAKEIHNLSKRSEKPFVAINCGAIPDTLIESELFGHKKGSFTGAIADKSGLFESANEGTFFMDEIGEMSLSLQVKLLRVLENGEVRRIGENESSHVNVRIISASNKDLWNLVESGKFREDLLFRLNVVQIYIPPLRERREDIPPLIRHLLEIYNNKYEKNIISIADDALSILLNYSYPGNVRELENILQHAVIFSENNTIAKNELPSQVLSSRQLLTPAQEEEIIKLDDIEKEFIKKALIKYNNNHTGAAKKLGISRSTLWRKIKKYNLL